MSRKKIVYFICTGNSCRSQMAEGFARHYGSDVVDVLSGGVEAHGINPRAIAAPFRQYTGTCGYDHLESGGHRGKCGTEHY